MTTSPNETTKEGEIRGLVDDLFEAFHDLASAGLKDTTPMSEIESVFEWLAAWTHARATGSDGDTGSDPAVPSSKPLRPQVERLHEITQELDRLLPGNQPTGAFDLARLHRGIAAFLDEDEFVPEAFCGFDEFDPTEYPEGRLALDAKTQEGLRAEHARNKEVILEVLRAHPDGLTAEEICEKANERLRANVGA